MRARRTLATRRDDMAVICDFCPHEDEAGKFSLDRANLAIYMAKKHEAPPTSHKAGCNEHLQEMLDELTDGRFWTCIDIMEAN
jgi:hypothetical protein